MAPLGQGGWTTDTWQGFAKQYTGSLHLGQSKFMENTISTHGFFYLYCKSVHWFMREETFYDEDLPSLSWPSTWIQEKYNNKWELRNITQKKKRNSRFVVFFFVVISLGTDLVTNSWKELTIQSVCPLCDIQFLLFAKLSKIKVFLVENENGKVSKCAKHFSFLLRQINIIPVRCRGTRCIKYQAKSKTSWCHLKKNRHEN